MRPLKILPCPEHSGKHPLHECRYIATADAEVEVDETPVTNRFGDQLQPDRSDWYLLKGDIVAKMTDTEDQAAYARLFVHAPELLSALHGLAVWTNGNPCFCHVHGESERASYSGHDSYCDAARAAIAKAEGRAQ